MATQTDRSHGYESIADEFARLRRASGIGLETIRSWAKQLPGGASVLDLGCGSGVPVAVELGRLGFFVAGVDASPTLIAEFHRQLPAALCACEAIEDSAFFERKFDGILAVGLIFLLPEEVQRSVIKKVGNALEPCGRFLFTAPHQRCEWQDVLTGQKSVSLGAEQYTVALHQAGLTLTETYLDEGENHYFSARKTGVAIAA
jgi:SAM-dependent methyltransferase